MRYFARFRTSLLKRRVFPRSSRTGVPTNSRIWHYLKLLDVGQGPAEDVFEMVMPGQIQAIPVLSSHESAQENQQFHANRLQSFVTVARGQAQPPEVVDDVDAQEQQLKERDAGDPVAGGYLRQRIVVDQLPDMFLDFGSRRIEAMDAPGAHFRLVTKTWYAYFASLKRVNCWASIGS